jgi:hypothetical protein
MHRKHILQTQEEERQRKKRTGTEDRREGETDRKEGRGGLAKFRKLKKSKPNQACCFKFSVAIFYRPRYVGTE